MSVLSLAEAFAPWRVPGDLDLREPVCHRLIAGRLGIAIIPMSTERVWLHVYFQFPEPCCDVVELKRVRHSEKVVTIWQGWGLPSSVLLASSRWPIRRSADSGVARGGAFWSN